jgi:hypothetical protein
MISEKYNEMSNNLYEYARSILNEINEIEEINGFSYLSIDKIGTYIVEFKGTATWRYGGREDYYFEFPSEILYCPNKKEKFINDLKKEVEENKKIEDERLRKLMIKKEEKDRLTYLALKERFEK